MTRPELAALKAAAERANGHTSIMGSSQVLGRFYALANPAFALRLVAHVERLEAALRAIEWGTDNDGAGHWCPECYMGPNSGHANDCIVGAALAATKEPDRG